MKSSFWTYAACLVAASLILVTGCSAPAPSAPPPPAAPVAAPATAVQPVVAASPAAPAAASQTKPKLKVWVEMSDNPKLFQDLFAKYASANNVDVEVVVPAPMDKILAALSGSDAPDIIAMSTATLAQSLAFQGLTKDLKVEAGKAGIDLNDIYPSSLVVCQQGSKLACLPWGTDTVAMFWNKDMFEAAGLNPDQPPKTLDELNAYNEKLTKKDAKGAITQMGIIPDYPWSNQNTINYLFGGSNYADGGHTLTVNSQANIDAYKWAQGVYQKYGPKEVTDFKSGFGDYASSENGFYTGKVAMMMDGEWQPGPNFIPKFKPELNYGVAPLPAPSNKPEMYGSSIVGGTIVVVPSNGKNPEEAAKLLAWMESPQTVADVMYQMANLPSSQKAAQDPRFKQIHNFQTFIDVMANPKSTGLLNSPVNQEVNDAMTKAEEAILMQGADVKTTLDAVQAQFEPKLKDAWSNLQ